METTEEDRGFQEKSTFFPLLISKTNDNWAVPISIHFRPECIGLNDCGLAGLIRIVNSENLYIMTNCKYFKIESISKVLFEKIFSNYIAKEQINRIYLNRMIPILHYFEKSWIEEENKKGDQTYRNLVKTVAFLPKSQNIQREN